MVTIPDPETGGEWRYFNAEPSDKPEDAVAGTLFEITEQELAAADIYEEDAGYRRILRDAPAGVIGPGYISGANMRRRMR